MIEELGVASKLLDSALNRYLDACLAIQKHYLEGNSPVTIPAELSSNVTSEARLASTFEPKLRRAMSAIYRVRNCAPALVPIHSLPQELLERIFLFVQKLSYSYYRCKCPDIISRVCFRWRGIALSSPSLWSFVLLPLTCARESVHLKRATTYAERASPLPLSLNFSFDPLLGSPPNRINLPALMANILPRTHSLEFSDSCRSIQPLDHDVSALSACLTQCEPTKLTTLITSIPPTKLGAPFRPWFFDITTPLPDYLKDRGYILNTGALDDILASITTLRLNGLYPLWTSKAYHGLVELRLVSRNLSSNRGAISELHLSEILRANPGLRVLELDLEIVESLPEDASIAPVRFSWLELFQVGPLACQELGTIVRWLSLGSIPLRLSLGVQDSDTCEQWLLGDEAAAFLSRSNVKEVHLDLCGQCSSTLTALLANCPDLQTLSLEGADLTSCSGIFPYPAWHSRLESLFVSGSVVDPHQIPIDSPGLKRLLFRECYYWVDSESYTKLCSDDLKHMAGRVPDVRVIDYDPRRDWAVFHV